MANAGDPMDVDMEPTTLPDIFSGYGFDIKSRYNPDKLLNNCPFVTMAYLLNTNAKTLMEFLKIRKDDPRGYSIEEIIHSLEGLGRKYEAYRLADKPPSGGSGGPIRGGLGLTEPKFSRLASKHIRRNKIGVAYKRKDGSGHVVVALNPGLPPTKAYLDFQIETKGTNVTKDVESSRIYMAFYFVVDKL